MSKDFVLTPARIVGRRRFLVNLGGGAMAFAVVGVAGCASSSDALSDGSPDDSAAAEEGSATTAGNTTSTTQAADVQSSAGLRWQQVQFSSVSAYLLIRNGEVAIVDTGLGRDPDVIDAGLQQLGAGWSDVGHVILTHSHPDHVGGLGHVMDRASGAAVYSGVADLPALDGVDGVDADTIRGLNDGDEVFGLQVVGTPGHTPGHITVFDVESGLLVAGDALVGSDGGLAGPPERFTPDMATANESVKSLARLDVDTVLVGHGSPVVGGAGQLLTELASSL